MGRKVDVTIACDRCGTEAPPSHGNDACAERGLVITLDGGEGAAFDGNVTGALCQACVYKLRHWFLEAGGNLHGTLRLGFIKVGDRPWPGTPAGEVPVASVSNEATDT